MAARQSGRERITSWCWETSPALGKARCCHMNSIVDLLVGPLSYPFMVRGLIASLMVGTLCAIVGCYVVLRGMAFLGDALAHAVLPGVAVAYLLGQPLLWGALLMGILVALGIGLLGRRGEVKEDTAIGIVFAASFA